MMEDEGGVMMIMGILGRERCGDMMRDVTTELAVCTRCGD
jgi:hypothetical protein